MKHHVESVKTYVLVFLALIALTLLTVGVAFINLGLMNTVVGVSIAIVKTMLVVWFFMHLKYSARILWLTAAAGAVWLLVMMSLTLSDYRTRDWLTQPKPWREPPAAVTSPLPPGH